MSLIGLDIGTTGCKAIVFAADGRILGQGKAEYAIATPYPNWAEQDAEAVWARAWACLVEATAAPPVAADPPQALALSCQGEAVIPVDAAGRALRPAILGMDTRTVNENAWLAETFGADELFRRTGMPVHTINTLPKLLWLKEHEPDTWRAAHQFLLYEDFFLRRLGGEATISGCLASRTQMMDLATGAWAADILERCGIDCGRLAQPAPAQGGPIGVLRRELADALGIAGEVTLAAGGHDQACAALGAGVIRPGLAMVSTGTAEVVEVALATPALDNRLRDGGISVYRHVVPGLFLAMTLNHSGGLLLRWFRDVLGRWQVELAAITNQDAYDLLLADAPAGPTALLLLPHFAGSGTPTLDTRSKGALLGLTFSTTQAAIAKAILEGLTFELRTNLDLLAASGAPVAELRAVGGGARSPLWLQLKADICNIPLAVPQVTEAACLGAALLGGVAAGVYGSFDDAVQATVHMRGRVEPQAEHSAAYVPRYALYQELYPLLRGLLHQL